MDYFAHFKKAEEDLFRRPGFVQSLNELMEMQRWEWELEPSGEQSSSQDPTPTVQPLSEHEPQSYNSERNSVPIISPC